MFMDFKTHRLSAIFELDELTGIQCYNQFRFHKSDPFELKEALQIPDDFWCTQGSRISGQESYASRSNDWPIQTV